MSEKAPGEKGLVGGARYALTSVTGTFRNYPYPSVHFVLATFHPAFAVTIGLIRVHLGRVFSYPIVNIHTACSVSLCVAAANCLDRFNSEPDYGNRLVTCALGTSLRARGAGPDTVELRV